VKESINQVNELDVEIEEVIEEVDDDN